MSLNSILFLSVVKKSKVFGGGGSGGNDFQTNSDMASKNAVATNAAKAWNRYVESYIPGVETPYIEDVISDPTGRSDTVQGTVNADVAKSSALAFNPSTGALDAESSFTPAKVAADAKVSGKQAVETQRLAAMQGLVDMGSGKQSTVDTGLEGLAKTEATDALSRAESDYNSDTAWSDSIGSAAGALANAASNWNSTGTTTSTTGTTTTPTTTTTSATGTKLKLGS